MSIIGTLRNKMGKFLVFVVGFSIASFVLGDILGPSSTLFGGNDTKIGTIKGEDIDLPHFNHCLKSFSTFHWDHWLKKSLHDLYINH